MIWQKFSSSDRPSCLTALPATVFEKKCQLVKIDVGTVEKKMHILTKTNTVKATNKGIFLM